MKIAGYSSMFTMVGVIVGGFVFMDDRHAHAEEMQQLEQRTVQTLETYQKTQLVNKLNRLAIKEQVGDLSKYDKILQKQLERELQLLSGSK